MADLQPPPPHWCFQCNSQILPLDLLCPHCQSGFIEIMDTAQSLPDVRRRLRRHLVRQRSALGVALSSNDEFADEPQDASLRQVLRLLRFLARASADAPATSAVAQANDLSQGSEGDGNDPLGPGSPLPPSTASSPTGGENQTERYAYEEEISSHSEIVVSAAGHEEIGEDTEDGSILFVGDEDEAADDDDDNDDNDFEADARLLELSDWESLDDEDEEGWEEVEYDEADLVVRFLEAVDGGREEGVENLHEDGELSEQEEGQAEVEGLQTRVRSQNNSSRLTNLLPRTLRRRLQDLRRNLENTEVRLETTAADTYVGNPGDYVDARGFEDLLQQLIDTDNYRRGAPPAAKSAVEGLPLVFIQQENLEDGSALCAICKDVVALDEPAKQLPCLHLYHNDCIIPWLSSRNSCPVCRYELPTDDPDYEEQKRSRNSHQTIRSTNSEAGESNGSSTLSQEDAGQSAGTEGNSYSESAITEAIDLDLETVKAGIEVATEQHDVLREKEVSSEYKLNDTSERSSLLDGIAGPFLSIVGLVVVSCLGNFFLSSSFQKRHRLEMEGQAGRLQEVQHRKPWWMRCFG